MPVKLRLDMLDSGHRSLLIYMGLRFAGRYTSPADSTRDTVQRRPCDPQTIYRVSSAIGSDAHAIDLYPT